LDNFEHVLPGASIVAELLAFCPGLAVLATSREPLRLRGKHEYAVPTLALPDAARAAPDAISHYAAVALFLERARTIRSDFSITDENAASVAEICARLDGLPLAIELAAARTRLLPPEAMLSRLGHGLSLLSGGRRDAPARQQTLRNAIAWSHDLLEPDEQRLFRRLGIFVGGFTLEAVEAVCDAGDDLGIDVEIRLARALYRFWWRRGHLSEGRAWLRRALERDDHPPVKCGPRRSIRRACWRGHKAMRLLLASSSEKGSRSGDAWRIGAASRTRSTTWRR
jgi:predicted ATPase